MINNPYGEIDNLSAFTHPVFNQKFKYMNDSESMKMAKSVFNKFIKSGFKNIVVVESGTSPLVYLIKNLPDYNNSDLNITQIKIPRDLNFNLFGWLRTNLTKKEMDEIITIGTTTKPRKIFLKEECQTFELSKFVDNKKFTIYDSIEDKVDYDLNSVSKFQMILRETNLSKIFNDKFLVFDEYINAGTIIRNLNALTRLFSPSPLFKLSAFCIFVDNINKYSKIAFSLYDNRNELECYQNGAYPFENRIDLIGYYYFINNKNFEKVYLADLLKEIQKNTSLKVRDFYKFLLGEIKKNNLLIRLKNSLTEEPVKNYVTESDVARYLIKFMEKKVYGDTKHYDFLDQTFEIFAPAWSPMPVKNHLDYWNGFSAIEKEIETISLNFTEQYKKFRSNILHDILNRFLKNRKEWIKRIKNLQKEEL